MQLKATKSSLKLPVFPSEVASVDVRFDGVRVWSVDVRKYPVSTDVSWPEALLPFLTGSTRVSIHDSKSGIEFAASETSFNRELHRTSVSDGSGTALAVNKWGHLGTALEDMGEHVQQLILERTAELITFLEQQGLSPFVVGGTLLGAVRDGALLPHDDDADIAYLSKHTHPSDVAHEAFGLGHRLTQAGYKIKRHSATHMQLLFQADAEATAPIDYYIDVFTAFFTADGLINQPFHVRGEMREDQMLPFSPVRIGDFEFPGPADTNRWLTINYDENWHTPIPGYQLDTPVSTRRRFDGWFGSYNLHREFWDEQYAHDDLTEKLAAEDATWAPGRAWLAAGEPRSGTLIDLGCGTGELTRQLAARAPGCRVIGADYSDVALARAASLTPDQPSAPEWAHANLYRATSLALPHDLNIVGPFDLVANHVFEQISHQGREWGWRLMRMALRSGGSVRFTAHTHHASGVRFEDPTGWHLTRQQLTEEASRFSLSLAFEHLISGTFVARTLPGRRHPNGVNVSLI